MIASCDSLKNTTEKEWKQQHSDGNGGCHYFSPDVQNYLEEGHGAIPHHDKSQPNRLALA